MRVVLDVGVTDQQFVRNVRDGFDILCGGRVVPSARPSVLDMEVTAGAPDPAVDARRYRYPMVVIRFLHAGTDDVLLTEHIRFVNYSTGANRTDLVNALALGLVKLAGTGGLDVQSVHVTAVIDPAQSGRTQHPAMSILLKRLKGLFVYEQWNCGIGRLEEADLKAGGPLALPQHMHWLPWPKVRTFNADPFVVDIDGIPWILYEYIDSREKGEIRARSWDGRRWGDEISLLVGEGHYSYPFIFRHAGEIFVLPEGSAAGRTVLYRLATDTMRLVEHAVLFEDKGIIDPTIVHQDGYWWLWGGMPGLQENASVFLWYATAPHGPWVPHPSSPLSLDVRSSRPGGSVWEQGGMLYRPAQDSSRGYGCAVAIHRIDRLTPEHYAETPVGTIPPAANWKQPAGFHTLSRDGQWVVVDALRNRYSLWLPFARIFERIIGR